MKITNCYLEPGMALPVGSIVIGEGARMKAVYVGEKLVAPGGCPTCGGALSFDLQCQRPSCNRKWGSLKEVQEAYDLVEKIAAITGLPARSPHE